jgi:peptidoglycan/xylan/chitin deacetylase (PgdA/CDA1 family)
MIRRGIMAPAEPRTHPLRILSGFCWILLAAGCGPVKPVPIFLWHSVGEGGPNDKYDVSVAEFEQQLQILNDQNIATVTLDQVLDDWEGKTPLPAKAVVLTFDDGRQCLYDQVMPALLRHRAIGEVFLVTSFLAESAAERKVIGNNLGKHPYLTWPEVQAMLDSGAFVVEAHSVAHPPLRKLSERRQRAEIGDSRRELQRRLAVPVKYFAYPFGSFSATTLQLTEQAGYRAAFSVSKGNNSRYQLTRHSMWQSSLATFQTVLKETFHSSPTR